VAGTPPFTYQWRFNGGTIVGATNTTLQFNNVQYTNGGTYAITVVNTAGTALSQPAELIVRPRFIGQPAAGMDAWQLTYEGTPNRAYAIELSTNQSDWLILNTNINSEVRAQWSHTNAPAAPIRVYRLRYAP
jgi:hypothetical protein